MALTRRASKAAAFSNAMPAGLPLCTNVRPFESFEVGFKYRSEGGSFVLNGAAFMADYTDIQLETLAPKRRSWITLERAR